MQLDSSLLSTGILDLKSEGAKFIEAHMAWKKLSHSRVAAPGQYWATKG